MKAHGATMPNAVSPAVLSKLTHGLKTVMNQYAGNTPDASLTADTLEAVQGKFWSPNPDVGDDNFMKTVWAVCDEAVKDVVANQETKPSSNFVTGRKSPVIYSTREGVDVALGLAQDGDGLTVASLDVNPGGSGINIARVLNNFGTPFELIGIHGKGPKGDAFIQSLRNEGITNGDFHVANTDSRTHFCTPYDATEYWLVDALPGLSTDEVDAVTKKVLEACERNQKEALTLSNGAPTGAHEGYMPEIVGITQDKHGMFTIYDPKRQAVGKDEVLAVLEKSPGLIKPNLDELGQLTDIDEATLRQDWDKIVHLAQELIKQYGVKMVLVSMDKDGAFLIDHKRAAHGNAPEIVVAGPGCAGDSGIAALIDRSKKRDFSLHSPNDQQFKDILQAFIAAGVATAAQPGSNVGTLEEAQRFAKQVNVDFV